MESPIFGLSCRNFLLDLVAIALLGNCLVHRIFWYLDRQINILLSLSLSLSSYLGETKTFFNWIIYWFHVILLRLFHPLFRLYIATDNIMRFLRMEGDLINKKRVSKVFISNYCHVYLDFVFVSSSPEVFWNSFWWIVAQPAKILLPNICWSQERERHRWRRMWKNANVQINLCFTIIIFLFGFKLVFLLRAIQL